jgi:hypothetical protein
MFTLLCAFLSLRYPNSTRLTFDADSGHSDQQATLDDDEEDGHDEGMSSLALNPIRTFSDVGSTVIITAHH